MREGQTGPENQWTGEPERPGADRTHGSLAAIVLVFAGLEPTTFETKAAIAASLGFEYLPQDRPSARDRLTGANRRERVAPLKALSDGVVSQQNATSSTASKITEEDDALSLVRIAEDVASRHHEADSDGDPLESADPVKHTRLLPHVPLVHEHWFAGVMFALIATTERSSDVDLRALEKQATAGRPFVALPFRRRRVLRRGVQVVLDHSESMQPFWRDQRLLVDRLEHWLGQGRVRSWAFDFDPWRPPDVQFEWFPPRLDALTPGTPLLIVSDFGGANEDWPDALMESRALHDLINTAKGLGCPRLGLVPLPSPRWPFGLIPLLDSVIEWDRSTSPQVAGRARSRVRG